MEQKNKKEFKYFISKIKDLIKYTNKETKIFDLNEFMNQYEEYIYEQFKMNEKPSKVFHFLLDKLNYDQNINTDTHLNHL